MSSAIKNSVKISGSQCFSHSSILRVSKGFSRTIAFESETRVFTATNLNRETSNHSNSFGLSLYRSEVFEDTAKGSQTATLRHSSKTIESVTEPVSYAWRVTERSSTMVFFMSIGLLIIVGIGFWIRSAYGEYVLTDVKRREHDDHSYDPYLTSSY
jgi:hypothetical protein